MDDEVRYPRAVSRRRFLKSGTTFAALATLAACGAPAATQTGSSATTEPAPGVAPDTGTATASLRLTFWGDLADLPTWQKGLDQFGTEQPNIKINWENTPWTEY